MSRLKERIVGTLECLLFFSLILSSLVVLGEFVILLCIPLYFLLRAFLGRYLDCSLTRSKLDKLSLPVTVLILLAMNLLLSILFSLLLSILFTFCSEYMYILMVDFVVVFGATVINRCKVGYHDFTYLILFSCVPLFNYINSYLDKFT